MRIAVLGAGAVGCLFGGRLHLAGQTVMLIHHRRSVAATIEKEGVRIRDLSGNVLHARPTVRTRLSRHDEPELVLVTVKAYDTEIVSALLEGSLMRGVPVLSLQNGLGNVDALEHRLGSRAIIAGTTTEAALTTGPGRVIHTGRGTTWLGEVNGRTSERCVAIARAFREASFRTVISNNMKGVIWAKAIVNSAVNPLSAITHVSNGDLWKEHELRELAFKIVDEGSAVARANRILVEPSPKRWLARILALTSGNKSSMLQDIEAARKTEIRQLNGSIWRLGSQVGMSTPFNELLTGLVLFMERSQGKL